MDIYHMESISFYFQKFLLLDYNMSKYPQKEHLNPLQLKSHLLFLN